MRQFTNQLAFFKAGQVTRYYRTWKPPGGPKDVATRTSAGLKSAWLGRSMKVTSYCWTATIAGLVGPKRENRTNRTYKLSRFLPTDWQTWEKPDSVILGAPPGFTFNDAGANPENVGETLSLRHSNDMNWWKNLQIKRDIAGGAIVGIFGGAARYVSIPHLTDLAVRKIPAPNELLNGPDYAR